MMKTNQDLNEKGELFITGLYGCKCHPYNSWAELKKFMNQKLKAPDKVIHRCIDKGKGKVSKGNQKNVKEEWVMVKWKDSSSASLEHVSNLIKV